MVNIKMPEFAPRSCTLVLLASVFLPPVITGAPVIASAAEQQRLRFSQTHDGDLPTCQVSQTSRDAVRVEISCHHRVEYDGSDTIQDVTCQQRSNVTRKSRE